MILCFTSHVQFYLLPSAYLWYPIHPSWLYYWLLWLYDCIYDCMTVFSLIDCDILCVESIRKCDTNFLLNWQKWVKRRAAQICCHPNFLLLKDNYYFLNVMYVSSLARSGVSTKESCKNYSLFLMYEVTGWHYHWVVLAESLLSPYLTLLIIVIEPIKLTQLS